MNKIVFLLSLIWLASGIHAQEKLNLKWGKVEAGDFVLPQSPAIDSNANAVIIADVGVTSFVGNKHGWFSYVFKRKTRIKVINKNGVDAANVGISLYSEDDSREVLDDLVATAYNLEGNKVVETKMGKKDIFEEALSKNHKEMKFTVPAVKAGSIIEYAYTINSDFYYEIPNWNFQSVEYPCLWSELEVKIPANLAYVFVKRGYHDFSAHETSTGHQTFRITSAPRIRNSFLPNTEELSVAANINDHRWIMKNLPPVRNEPYISTARNYIDRIEFQLRQINNGEETTDVSSTWTKATEDVLKNESFGLALTQDNDWLKNDLAQITAGTSDPLQQSKKIYYYITSNFTCLNHQSKWLTSTLNAAYKKRSGTVGDINLLLIAMLRLEGLQADPVLLSTREFGTNFPNYPLLDRLDYVICREKIADKIYYLDASEPILGFGILPERCYNGHARVFSNTDSSVLYFYPDSLKEQRKTNVIIINDEKGIPSGGFQSTQGYYQSYDTRKEIKATSEKEFFKKIQSYYGSDFALGNTGIDSLDKLEGPVTIHYDFDFSNWKDQDIVYFNPMMSESHGQNPFKSADRLYPVEMEYSVDKIYTLNMDVPKGFVVDELPKPAKVVLNGNDGEFEYLIQKSNEGIQLRCRLKINKATFAPNEYNTLRDFYAFVVNKENEQIVFKKKK